MINNGIAKYNNGEQIPIAGDTYFEYIVFNCKADSYVFKRLKPFHLKKTDLSMSETSSSLSDMNHAAESMHNRAFSSKRGTRGSRRSKNSCLLHKESRLLVKFVKISFMNILEFSKTQCFDMSSRILVESEKVSINSESYKTFVPTSTVELSHISNVFLKRVSIEISAKIKKPPYTRVTSPHRNKNKTKQKGL